MGRLSRVAASTALAGGLLLQGPMPAAGFDGFGDMTASATYGVSMEFSVELLGAAPDELELVFEFPSSDADLVVPVEARGRVATYVWDAAAGYVTPNTLVIYHWRATTGGEAVLSEPGELLYDDDRAGLDWQTAAIGEAKVHWYGEAEAEARLFGETTAVGVDRAEALLGTELAGPVDIFVYNTRDEFFGALGPGVREWAGAAAYPEVRSIFIWLEGGSQSYLESVIIHEVTHVVFFDATDNPYHEPALWLNEGIATWSEMQSADGEREVVEAEATGAGLFAFDAITERFPIGERGGFLAYAQGTTLIEQIVDRYGPEAVAGFAAAYRAGASDAEALEAGTGVPADELYASFFDAYGVEEPGPIEPEQILPSNVELPPGASPGAGAEPPPPATTAAQPAPAEDVADGDGSAVLVLLAIAAGVAVAGGAAVLIARRAARPGGPVA